MFQRRHYEAIARIFARGELKHELIDSFCVMLKYDNPNFNESRFRAKIINLSLLDEDGRWQGGA